MLSLPVLLLLITAAPVLPRGKLTSLFSTALLVVLLRNYVRFNSLLCSKGRKESTVTHVARTGPLVKDVGFIKMSVFTGSTGFNIAWVLLVKFRVCKMKK